VFVVNTRPASVIVLDLKTHTAAKYICHCTPAGLLPLNGRATFVFSHPVDGPLWLFDGDAGQPRVVFVPSPGPAKPSTQGSVL
jgi:hypothetical protein